MLKNLFHFIWIQDLIGNTLKTCTKTITMEMETSSCIATAKGAQILTVLKNMQVK